MQSDPTERMDCSAVSHSHRPGLRGRRAAISRQELGEWKVWVLEGCWDQERLLAEGKGQGTLLWQRDPKVRGLTEVTDDEAVSALGLLTPTTHRGEGPVHEAIGIPAKEEDMESVSSGLRDQVLTLEGHGTLPFQ